MAYVKKAYRTGGEESEAAPVDTSGVSPDIIAALQRLEESNRELREQLAEVTSSTIAESQQDRDPRPVTERFQIDPKRHYVLVEAENPHNMDYEPPLAEFLEKTSPTTGGAMYFNHGCVRGLGSDGRKLCDHSRLRLLSCSKADYDLTVSESVGRGKSEITPTKNPADRFNANGAVIRQQPRSLADLHREETPTIPEQE